MFFMAGRSANSRAERPAAASRWTGGLLYRTWRLDCAERSRYEQQERPRSARPLLTALRYSAALCEPSGTANREQGKRLPCPLLIFV